MTDNAQSAAHLYISGNVQGVFFRDSTRQQANQLGVAGWVKNLPDGRVEAHLEGPKEKVQQVIEWAHRGPPQARVEDVQVEWTAPEGHQGFEVRR